MKNFLLKQTHCFYFDAASILSCLIGIIFYVVCSKGGYYDDTSAVIITLLAFAIFSSILTIGLRNFFEKIPGVRFINLASVCLSMFALLSFILDRVLSIGFLLGSALGSDNVLAMRCLILSFVSMGFILLSVILSIIASFGSYEKVNK